MYVTDLLLCLPYVGGGLTVWLYLAVQLLLKSCCKTYTYILVYLFRTCTHGLHGHTEAGSQGPEATCMQANMDIQEHACLATHVNSRLSINATEAIHKVLPLPCATPADVMLL